MAFWDLIVNLVTRFFLFPKSKNTKYTYNKIRVSTLENNPKKLSLFPNSFHERLSGIGCNF